MNGKGLSITNISAISAIYFALLQCKYDFYAIERDAEMVERLRSFIIPECNEYSFFSEVRQNTCEVYPYWPRAAMLETATFYMDLPHECFYDFHAYKNTILSAANISDIERNQLFWDWITKFPSALKYVLQSNHFHRYLEWETAWIEEQNDKYKKELENIWNILVLCMERFKSPIQTIQVVINPIKCVYSADHHLKDNHFIFCSGCLSEESVIHEFIHHIVHPIVENRKNEILRCNMENLNIDTSYYLNHDELGAVNAFEEYVVRSLTDVLVSGNVPKDLNAFFDQYIRLG